MHLLASMGSVGTVVLPGKAGGGREKDICEMPEASPPRSAAVGGREGWRASMGKAGELGDPKQPRAAPKLLSVPGMGGSWQCRSVLGLAFRFACAPSLHRFPLPVALQNACAAYEMEEIKLQDLRIGRALCNI